MLYVSDTLLAEVTSLRVTLRREDGRVLTLKIDAQGNPLSVRDNTGFNLGIDELTKAERHALKRLVEID